MTLPKVVPPLPPGVARRLRRERGRGMGITHHAIEQYRARFGGDEDALRELVSGASPTRERTPGGQEVWTADGVRLVVKRDRGVGPVVVTVLPAVVTEEREDEMPEGGWW